MNKISYEIPDFSGAISQDHAETVREAIDYLQSSLESEAKEDELLALIKGRITFLRRSYVSHKRLFTPADLVFLKTLSAIVDHLRDFIDLKEESLKVNSLEEYDDIAFRLNNLRKTLSGYGVARRIGTEIRALNEKLPLIREQHELQRESRFNMRVLDLEKNGRRCSDSHPMAIRHGANGHFWGCSRYPTCCETAPLTGEEKRRLTG